MTPRTSLIILFAASLLAGCAGSAVSPTDKTLIAQADQLHARLGPAVVEDKDPKLKRYFEQLGQRILTAAKDADQQGLIRPPTPASGSNERHP